MEFDHNGRLNIEMEVKDENDYRAISHVFFMCGTYFHQSLTLSLVNEIDFSTIDDKNKDFAIDFVKFVEQEYFINQNISNILTTIVVDRFINNLDLNKKLFQFANEDWYKLFYIIKMLTPDNSRNLDIQNPETIETLNSMIVKYNQMIEFYGKI